MNKLLAFAFSLILAQGPAKLPILGVGSAAAGGAGTWASTQLKYFDSSGNGTGGSSCAVSTNTCTVNVSSVGASHLLTAFVMYVNSTAPAALTLVATSSGETWTHCSGCAFLGTSGSGNGIDQSYILTTVGSETTVTCTLSGTNNAANAYIGCGVFEYSWSGSTRAFDVAGGGLDATCTSCAGTALTLTGSSDVIIQLAVPESAISAITGGAGYTNPQQFYGTNGMAGAINTTNGAAPTWTQSPTGRVTISALAIKGS